MKQLHTELQLHATALRELPDPHKVGSMGTKGGHSEADKLCQSPLLLGPATPQPLTSPATIGTDLQGVSLLQDVKEELGLEDGGGLGRVRGQGHEAPVLVAGTQVLLEDLREVLQGGGEERQRAGAVQDEVPCREGEGRAGP